MRVLRTLSRQRTSSTGGGWDDCAHVCALGVYHRSPKRSIPVTAQHRWDLSLIAWQRDCRVYATELAAHLTGGPVNVQQPPVQRARAIHRMSVAVCSILRKRSFGNTTLFAKCPSAWPAASVSELAQASSGAALKKSERDSAWLLRLQEHSPGCFSPRGSRPHMVVHARLRSPVSLRGCGVVA